MVRIKLVSRPSGIKLRAGKLRRVAPFAVTIRLGSALNLRAPAEVKRGGETLELRGWRVKGKLRKGPALRVVGRADARYVALYAR